MKHVALYAALSLLAAPPVMAQTVKYSNWMTPHHPMHVEVFKPWMTEVEKVTEGRVKFDIPPKTVGTVPTQFDVLRDGLADMAVFVPGFSPARFEMIEVAELPLFCDEPEVMAPATYAMYEKHLKKYNEFKGVHIVSIFTTAPGHILTGKKPIRSMADLKGMKLRMSIASSSMTITSFGAVPVQRPVTEVFELISTGVLDGTFSGKEQLISFNLLEVMNNLLVVPGGLYNSVLALGISEDRWNSISQKDRDLMMKGGGEAMATAIGRTYAKSDEAAVAAMKAANKNIVVANDAFLADIRKAVAGNEQAWIEKAKKKGLANPEMVIADFRADIAQRQKASGKN